MHTLFVLAALAAASPAAAAGKLTLKSTDVKPSSTLSDQQVFDGFGCTGANVSPELSWENAPKDTKSFAVTVFDPDAPTGSGWWHWIVYDVPAATTGLPQGAGSGGAPLPEGAKQGRNDYGAQAFGGACPPPGAKPHRYVFTLYALKTDKLDVPEGASSALIAFNLKSNALASATITATYGRKK
jgi:hypothetical protein